MERALQIKSAEILTESRETSIEFLDRIGVAHAREIRVRVTVRMNHVVARVQFIPQLEIPDIELRRKARGIRQHRERRAQAELFKQRRSRQRAADETVVKDNADAGLLHQSNHTCESNLRLENARWPV